MNCGFRVALASSMLLVSMLQAQRVAATETPAAKAQNLREGGLIVQVGRTVHIMPASATKCSYVGAKKLANGDIIVTIPWPRTGMPIESVRSKDGGLTWDPARSALSDDEGRTWQTGPTPIFENHLVLTNGEVIGFDFPNRPGWLWHFNADGTTGVVRKTAVVPGEDASLFAYQHTMAQLADGRILATSQIKRPGDAKSRVNVHVSCDDGLTWKFLATVANDPSERHQEGFTEPRLLKLPQDELLCFLRTANPDTAARKGFTYQGLEMSRSIDGGKTWDAPATVAPRGVYPDAVLMENGIIALAYGRPGNNMMFSADRGRTWACNLRVADTIRAPDCGFYNSIIEVSPGNLLLVYSTGEEVNQPSAIVLGTFLRVERMAER